MKVWPANDTMRKILKHPSDNVGFREEGPSEWPDDQFTARRVMDGDVVLGDPGGVKTTEPTVEVKSVEEPAAAEEPKPTRSRK